MTQLQSAKTCTWKGTARPTLVEQGNGQTAVRCVVALLGVTVFGTVGFLLIEDDWDLWQSLYFTLITITTVGYGDQGISSAGQKFASVLLLVGIGTATYSLTAMVQFAVGYQLAWKWKMQQHINKLQDHIVVCGFGRMGKTVCDQLAAEGVPFVVVERSEQDCQEAIDCGYEAIAGDATEDVVLRKAGAHRARGVVCVVNSDAENVFITLSARALNEEAFIACRADTDGAVDRVERAGASLVVAPHFWAGMDVARAILRPHLSEFLRGDGGLAQEFELNEITVEDGSQIVGQTIAQYGRTESLVVFVAIKRKEGDRIIRPHGNIAFQSGDVVIVAGDREAVSRMYHDASVLAG